MSGSAQFIAGNFGGTGKARILWFDSVADARATPTLFAIADAVEIKDAGIFYANPSSVVADDGINAFQVTGVNPGRFLFSPASVEVNGVPVTSLSFPSDSVSIAGGVATIQPVYPQQDTVGQSILDGALVWGSSLSATVATAGGAIADATIAAITPNGMTLTAGATGPLPNQTAVTCLEDTSSGGHYFGLAPAGLATGGKRTRMKFYFKPIGATSARRFHFWTNGTVAQNSYYYDSETYLGEGTLTSILHWDTWKRADGWYQAELTFENASNQVYFKPNGGNYAGSISDGFLIAGLDIRQEYVSAINNLATGSAATITASVNGPDLDTVYDQFSGWIDRTPAFLWKERDSATLTISTIHTVLSGTDTPCSFSFLWEPYSEVDADSTLFSVSGATASLVIAETAASLLKVTRTNNDGTSSSVTFVNYIGLTAQACSIVLTGTRAQMYLQDRLVDDQPFATGKLCTFTGTTMGSGTLRARFAEFAIFGTALSSWQAIAAHQSLAARRGWSIAPLPVWLHLGQSNCLPNGNTSQLTDFLLAADGRSIHYETNYGNDAGWGRARGCTSSTTRKWRMSHAGQVNYGYLRNGTFGSELYFMSALGRVATARYAVGGTGITSFLPGGAYHAAMLAGFDDAFAKIGIPCYLEGFLIDWGENDSYASALASAFPSNVDALVGILSARYDATTPKVICTKLHANLTIASFPYRDTVRAAEIAHSAAVPTRWALTSIDDQLLSPADNTHRLSPNTQRVAGARMGVAAQLLQQIIRY